MSIYKSDRSDNLAFEHMVEKCTALFIVFIIYFKNVMNGVQDLEFDQNHYLRSYNTTISTHQKTYFFSLTILEGT